MILIKCNDSKPGASKEKGWIHEPLKNKYNTK